MGLVLLWWLVVLVAGLAAYPIGFVLFKQLPDKGYVFSKVLALLLVGYLTWILGYLSFNGGTLLLSFLLLTAVSAVLLWTWIGKAFLDFARRNLGHFLVVEGLFLVSFLVAGAYKMRTHDIAGTEKPMDFAMINGILASGSMPPQDPWLAGAGISYYYFGYLITALLCRATQVSPGEAYNLAVALIWALAFLAAFSLAHAMTRRYRYSLVSALCLAVMGNQDFWHRCVQSFKFGDLRIPYYNFPADPQAKTGWEGLFGFLTAPLQHYWDYFQASRIIPVPPTDKMINEFPSFSFFLSDLHPHVMAIPFTILAAALAFNLLKAQQPGLGVFAGTGVWRYFQWVLAALVFGSLAFMNSWDFPTYLFLVGICLFLQQWWVQGPNFTPWFRAVALVGIPLVIGSFLLYLPFYLRFQSQAQGVGISLDRTDLYYLVVIFGAFLVLAVPFLVGKVAESVRPEEGGRTRSKRNEDWKCSLCGAKGTGKKFCGTCGGDLVPAEDQGLPPIADEGARSFLRGIASRIFPEPGSDRPWWVLGILVLLLLAGNLEPVRGSTLLLSILMILACVLALSSRSEERETVFAVLLVMTAFLLVACCEVLYLRDLFTGALYRMNTVFKFHYQAWILLSLASGPMLQWLLGSAWPRWPGWKRGIWCVFAAFFFLGAFLYPALAFTSRMRGSASDMVTLDGAVFYEHVFPTDYQAAQWIKANVKPVQGRIPVVLEAWGGSYHQEYARLATNTGYPTVLGWDFHEVQWRGSGDKAVVRGKDPDDTIVRRQGDVDAIYTSPDLALTKSLLAKYGVQYVYVGDIERQKYKDHPENLGKFAQLGAVAQTFGNSVLYRVNP